MKRDLGSMLSSALDMNSVIEQLKNSGGNITILNFGQGGQEVGLPEGLPGEDAPMGFGMEPDGDEMGGLPADMDGDEMPMDAMPVEAAAPEPPLPVEEPAEPVDSLKGAIEGALAKGGSKNTDKKPPKKDAKKAPPKKK